MAFQDMKNGFGNILKIDHKKGALCPFLLTTDYVADLAVVSYVLLSNAQVVVLAVVPFYSTNFVLGRSSTFSTGLLNACDICARS